MKRSNRYRLPTGLVLMTSLLLAFSTSAFALTDSDFIDKAEEWMDARDDAEFTASITNSIDVGSGWTEVSTGAIYFEDDVSNGWSVRLDLTLSFPGKGTVVLKIVDTPSGDQAFFDGDCIYVPTNEIAFPYVTQSHTNLPKVFFDGDNSHSADEALAAMASSSAAETATLGGTSAYRLEITLDNSAMNDRLAGTDTDFGEGDSATQTYYINASSGAPMQMESSVYEDAEDDTFYAKSVWSDIDTSPDIPSGTFDLTEDQPTMSYEEALAAWLEAN